MKFELEIHITFEVVNKMVAAGVQGLSISDFGFRIEKYGAI